jgi:hypothetical protein
MPGRGRAGASSPVMMSAPARERRTCGPYSGRARTQRWAVLGATLALASLAISVLSAQAEVTQGSNVRVIFKGKLTPRSLPRSGLAPVRVAVGATIVPAAGTAPPSLRKIQIEINRHGRFDLQGLPVCRFDQIQPSSTRNALASCKPALVGKGHFSSTVLQPEASPFPSEGTLYAFNGTYKGKPAILAHVYGTEPIPTSYTIPFTISSAKGDYGTALTAPMPNVGNEWGFITGLSLNLGRTFHYRGQRHSYVAAGCPAPKGVSIAPFDFARATFSFGVEKVSSVLSRSCRAHG